MIPENDCIKCMRKASYLIHTSNIKKLRLSMKESVILFIAFKTEQQKPSWNIKFKF